MKGGPFGDIKKFCGLTKPKKKLHKKFWSRARTRPSAWQTSKNPQKIRSRRSYISVAVSGSQLIKPIKSVTSLVLKKVTAIVCVFYEKRRLKTIRLAVNNATQHLKHL